MGIGKEDGYRGMEAGEWAKRYEEREGPGGGVGNGGGINQGGLVKGVRQGRYCGGDTVGKALWAYYWGV